MLSPIIRNRLRAQASNLIQTLASREFNMRLREDELTREERARLNRVNRLRRRAVTRLQRRLCIRAA